MTAQLCTEWLTLHVPVPPGWLTARSIDEAVAMAAARLRWMLGQRAQQQVHERAVARSAERAPAGLPWLLLRSGRLRKKLLPHGAEW
ncbi:hypothetical protein A5681_04535 [Mycobacterium scrofulaceum]|nr:hypothetical protein A5681_04535 [Mycobacterium scrofulaceum]